MCEKCGKINGGERLFAVVGYLHNACNHGVATVKASHQKRRYSDSRALLCSPAYWSRYDFSISRASGWGLSPPERLDGTEQKGIDVSLRRALWSLDGLRDGSGRNRRRAVAIVGSVAVVRDAFRSGSNEGHQLVHGDGRTIKVRTAANVAVVNYCG